MTQALRQFARSDEMREFVADARKQRRKVVVEVFHASDGHPLLIHTTVLREKTA
jgi:CTP:molybdopterin cytidylyltransferase MocA